MNKVQKPPTPIPPEPGDLPLRIGRGPVPLEVKEKALVLLASGIKPTVVAKTLGVTYESVRLWRKAKDLGIEAQPQPLHPGGLSQKEVDSILDLKKKHPNMGPAQIKAQLKRFQGLRVSHKAIARVLKNHGYELEKRGKEKRTEEVHRWEAPYRNALWQMDFADLRIGAERVSLLLILDDFSRFLVGAKLMTEVTSEAVVEALEEAIRKHGKPQAVYTDRGGPFLAWRQEGTFKRFLEKELIDHHVSPAYRPQGRGKIEALIHTVQKELWEVVHFESVEEARKAVMEFVHRYNHERAHMGIDGLTPADRFFGRWGEVKARIEEEARRRERRLEEGVSRDEPSSASPLEVVRMMVVEDRMEIRLLGHRVVVGKVEG